MSLYRRTQREEGLPLFQTEAHARKSDPDTSRAAARRASRTTLQARVLEVLRDHPAGLTSHEIAEVMDVELVAVSPRLAPLRRKGLVKGGPIVDGRTIWLAVES